MKDRVDNDVNVGDFILYVTKSEAPGIQFGWVEDIQDKREEHTNYRGHTYYSGDLRMKIAHAHPDGTVITKTTVDVPGHWIDDIPGHEHSWYGPEKCGSEHYVSETLRDTGISSTVWLKVSDKDYRMLVTKPI